MQRVYGSWSEVLEDREADVVAVLLPHDVHARFATEALEAGHHVVVEKPMATTLADCDAMMAAARKAGKRLHPVHNRVYDPATEAVQAFLASGAIGDVFLAQTVGLEPPQTVSVRPWLGTPAGGGGVLLAQAVHPAYVLRWLLGDVAEVACLTAARQGGGDVGGGHRRGPPALPLGSGGGDDGHLRAPRRAVRARDHPLRPGRVRGDPQPAGGAGHRPPALRRPRAPSLDFRSGAGGRASRASGRTTPGASPPGPRRA